MSSRVLGLYQKLVPLPAGRWLFSRIICFRAPYFGTIKPRVQSLSPGQCRITMKKRRSVLNHIGGVHALAMGNLCELAAGLVTEVSLPAGMRWIPRGMTIRYLRQAHSSVEAVASIPEPPARKKQDVVVAVEVVDQNGDVVVSADITMYLSPRDGKA